MTPHTRHISMSLPSVRSTLIALHGISQNYGSRLGVPREKGLCWHIDKFSKPEFGYAAMLRVWTVSGNELAAVRAADFDNVQSLTLSLSSWREV